MRKSKENLCLIYLDVPQFILALLLQTIYKTISIQKYTLRGGFSEIQLYGFSTIFLILVDTGLCKFLFT